MRLTAYAVEKYSKKHGAILLSLSASCKLLNKVKAGQNFDVVDLALASTIPSWISLD